ncbi:MAG: hypothetical protein HQ561_13395 [Desulfobacteraceae bacterium]|nr:hypothetical protein [Desulfobacteraceae bacterium]
MMRALFVFAPPESKRFIAKAVSQLPEVTKAKETESILIAHGSTNVRVAQEILGQCPEPDKFLSGEVINGILCITQAEEKPPMIVVRKGKLVPPALTMEETLEGFGAGSVFIKGANAVDPEGNAGVYVAHPSAGTIGFAYGILSARGIQMIVPVGLEKLVPSIKKAAQHVGQDTLYYCMGIKIGMLPIVNAKVITEVEAFQVLFGLEAVHIGSGGVNGSEGSVVLAAEGEKEKLDQAIELIESIKGEPPLRPKKSLCSNCLPTTPSTLASPDKQFSKGETKHCMFQGKKEQELPPFIGRKSD